MEKTIKLGDGPDGLKRDDMDLDDKQPSPFKQYEDKYCSHCQDYRGCIGLIDSVAIKSKESSNLPGLPDDISKMMKSFSEQSSGYVASQRFNLIATCMGARYHMDRHVIKKRRLRKDSRGRIRDEGEHPNNG